METLPNEMICAIFEHMSSDSLLACRLVKKDWNLLITRIFMDRLESNRTLTGSVEFCTFLSFCENSPVGYPFKSIKINASKIPIHYLEQFLTTYGPDLKSGTFSDIDDGTSDDILTKTLTFLNMTNLVKLEIFICFDEGWLYLSNDPYLSPPIKQLPNLKHLTTRTQFDDDNNEIFLMWLLNAAQNLKYASIEIPEGDWLQLHDPYDDIGEPLSRVPYLDLVLNERFDQISIIPTLINLGIKLQELEINLNVYRWDRLTQESINENLQRFHNLLSQNAQNLLELSIYLNFDVGELRIPSLHNLKKLSVNCEGGGFISLNNENEFPALEIVSISSENSLENTVINSATLETLILKGSLNPESNLPHLTKASFDLTKSERVKEELILILKSVRHIEVLSIYLSVKSGREVWDAFCDHRPFRKVVYLEKALEQHWKRLNFHEHSFCNFKSLKKLKIIGACQKILEAIVWVSYTRQLLPVRLEISKNDSFQVRNLVKYLENYHKEVTY